jgi:hypothetical protein
MTNNGSDGLFEVPAGAGADPFEQDDLRQRTDFQSRAGRAGADFKAIAIKHLTEAGASIERVDFEVDGFPVDAEARGGNGRRYLVLSRGTPDEQDRSGLKRPDTVEKVGFMAIQLGRRQSLPILIITSDLPDRSTKTGHYLASLSADVWDVVSLRADLRGFQRLRSAFNGPADSERPSAPWRSPAKVAEPSLFDCVVDDHASDHDDGRRPAVNDDEGRP